MLKIFEQQIIPFEGPDDSRGLDNFKNSKQYILEQLFIYDYTNEAHLNILKNKLWVLDGEIRQSEYVLVEETSEGFVCEFPDTDITTPMDHWSTLQNDLVYLDKYIRTKDKKLEKDPEEVDFNTFWDERISAKEDFIKTINEETGELYKDYEQDYLSRPTLLEKNDFKELYGAYKLKEEQGELSSSFDITGKITDYCIDREKKQAEDSILSNTPADEVEKNLKVQAGAMSDKNDSNYVTEMEEAHDELLSIILEYIPSLPTETVEQGEGEEPVEEPYGSLMLCNIPEKRVQVGTTKNHESHRGPIIRQMGTGGYRFIYRDGQAQPAGNLGPNLQSSISPDLVGELEDTWEHWTYAHYYEETDETSGQVTSYLAPLTNSLPSGGSSLGDKTQERFDLLNKRWITLNNLREYQVMDNGTRSIIESMVNAEVPELLGDKESHGQDKKDQKKQYIESLQEKYEEFT